MNNILRELGIVFIGGGLGSILRFSSSLVITNLHLRSWVATLIVNILGAAIMLTLSFRFQLNSDSSRFINTGFLGALTTFSTFSLEVVTAFKNGHIMESFLILFLNIFLGIIVGIWIFR